MESNDPWSVATAQDNGKPLIFRIRNRPPAFAKQGDFPHMLAVSWKYKPSNEGGMPPQDVVSRMDQFEELLDAAFDRARAAFLTVVVTGNGVREFQWYAKNVEQAMLIVNQALGEYEPFPVEFSFDEDPQWEAYSQFLDLI